MQKNLLIVTIALVIISAIKLMLSLYFVRREENEPVYISYVWPVDCIAVASFMCIASIVFFLGGYKDHSAMFGYISVVPAILSICLTSFKISYSEEGFVHTSFFGIRRLYRYDEIKGYEGQFGKTDVVIYVRDKTISIDKHALNQFSFFKYASLRYKTANGGHTIKKISSTSNRYFGSRLKEPASFIFSGVSMIFVSTAALIVSIIMSRSPINENNSEHFKVSFSSYELSDGEAKLYAYPSEEKTELFVINNPEAAGIWKSELSFAAAGGECDVWVKTYAPEGNESYCTVRRMTCGEVELYSFSDAEQAQKEKFSPVIRVCFALTLISLILFVAGVVAARNPEKYPFLAKLIFRHGQLNLGGQKNKILR